MHTMVFATLAGSDRDARDVLLLAASLRRFGGALSAYPLWMLFPPMASGSPCTLPSAWPARKCASCHSTWRRRRGRFRLAEKCGAAAAAETLARGQAALLAWLDRDTLVLNGPAELLLPADKSLGYRPVHHRLVGPAWDAPRDSFWQLVDRHCQVPVDHIFPMTTHVGEEIQPYFNAGCFVVRPEQRLLGQWWNRFESARRRYDFAAFIEADARYGLFLHQAIFTGVLLHALTPSAMEELSARVNYPLHLHDEVRPARRPVTFDALITARHEQLFDRPGWRERLPFSEPFLKWLSEAAANLTLAEPGEA